MTKDETLTTIAIIILLFTSMITWNTYSWLILIATIIILIAWYTKPKKSPNNKRSLERALIPRPTAYKAVALPG